MQVLLSVIIYRSVHYSKASSPVEGAKFFYTTAKTASSNRVIPMTDEVYEILQNHVIEIELAKEEKRESKIFEVFTCHALRHTYATRCYENGVDQQAVQKLSGHSTLAMTTDLYTHVSEDCVRVYLCFYFPFAFFRSVFLTEKTKPTILSSRIKIFQRR